MRKGKRKVRWGRVLGVILSICMIAGNISISLTQSWADDNDVIQENTEETQPAEETTSEADTQNAGGTTGDNNAPSVSVTTGDDSTQNAGVTTGDDNTPSVSVTTGDDSTQNAGGTTGDDNTPSVSVTTGDDSTQNADGTTGDDNTLNVSGTTPVTEETANPAKTGTGAGGTLNASISAEKVSAVFGARNATFSKGEDGANKITLLSSVQLENSITISTDVTIELSGCSVTAPSGSAALIIGGDGVKVSLTNSDSGKTAKVIGGVGADAYTGNAGRGGDGITITGSSAALSIGENVEISGGAGGNITNTVTTESVGNGGDGGNGITDTNNNSTITVNGSVVGGDGGYGCTISGSKSNGGNGGWGVSSTNTSGVTCSGTVKGGNGGASGSAGNPGAAGTGASGNVTNAQSGNGGYRLAITVKTDIGNLDFDDFEESAYQTKADMSGVLAGLTDEEKAAGNTVSLNFNVNVLTDDEFTGDLAKDKAKADEELGDLKASEKRIYYDFEITKNITSTSSNDNKTITVTKTPSPVVLTLVLPKSLQNGNYKIVRVHDGVTEELPVENDGKTVTFSSMQFSTFVLDYTPKTDTTSQPAADDDQKQDSGNQQNNNDTQPSGTTPQSSSDTQPSGTTSQGNSDTQPSGTTPQGSSDTQPSGTTLQSNSKSQGGASTGTVTALGNGTNAAAGVQGSGTNTAVNTSGSGTATVNTARYVASDAGVAQVTGAKDSEPTTGDIRQSSALIFVRLGTAAAVVYLLSVLIEALSRRKKG